MKRLLLRLSVVVLLGVPLALFTAVYLCFEEAPLVRRATEFRSEDVERAVRLIEKHDPRRMKSGTLRTLSMPGEDLDLLVNYLANRYGKASSRIVLQPGVLKLSASVEVPASPVRPLSQRAGDAARDGGAACVRPVAHRSPAGARLAR